MAKNTEHHNEFSQYPATGHRARELGITHYFTGKRCSKGHLHLRYASSGNCVMCIEEKRGTVELNFRGKSSKRSYENQKLAEQALSNGQKTYIPTKPCKHGHKERFVGGNNCVQCSYTQYLKRKESAKWARIKKIYGITKDCFYKMLFAQKSKCSICSIELNEKNTHIDHCHDSKRVRSLLCSRCNQAIGLLDESIDRFYSAIKYLKKYNNET